MTKKVSVCLVIVFLFIPTIFAQTKYLNISPCEFRPEMNGQTYSANADEFTGIDYFFAPVHLPNNAVIKNVMICYQNTFTMSVINVTMVRKKCDDFSDSQVMFSWVNPAIEPGLYTKIIPGASIWFKTIYNYTHSYAVRVSTPGSMYAVLYGIRIAYED